MGFSSFKRREGAWAALYREYGQSRGLSAGRLWKPPHLWRDVCVCVCASVKWDFAIAELWILWLCRVWGKAFEDFAL